MCGRFAQYSSRNDYFNALSMPENEIIYDPQPIGRYKVAPGTRVLLLNRRMTRFIVIRCCGDTALTGGIRRP